MTKKLDSTLTSFGKSINYMNDKLSRFSMNELYQESKEREIKEMNNQGLNDPNNVLKLAESQHSENQKVFEKA